MGRPAFPGVAIAGAYNTPQAKSLPGHSTISIMIDAVRGVLSQSGIPVDEVDGVFGRHAGEIVYNLGLGASSTSALASVGIPSVVEAAQAVMTGMCDVAVAVGGGAGVFVDRDATAPWTRPTNEWVAPFGLYTAVEFALMARRHMHQFGTTPEQLATVAATIRNNGSVNPEAVFYGRGPFTPADILESRMIADPFHLLDCAMTSEGACAIVVTRLERARDAALMPVHLLGAGTDRIGPAYQHAPSWDLGPARTEGHPAGLVGRRAARRAFSSAGLGPADVDVCEFYDPFSFEIIRQFEAFEFCDVGEGGDFILGGRIAADGPLPTTTDGGLLSFSHAGSGQQLQRVARGVHQLQSICASNQVADVEVVLCSNGGSGALYTDVLLLGKEAA